VLKPTLIAAVAGVAFLAAACTQEGTAEKAGERADSAVEETTQGQRDLSDGPMEKAGEALDRAGNDVERKVDEATPPPSSPPPANP